ncbi:MAG TPA: hypothetical protein PK299_07520 [Anaerolineales bacterium]|nr:hypothetical protein [Anaerolineales bacterium]
MKNYQKNKFPQQLLILFVVFSGLWWAWGQWLQPCSQQSPAYRQATIRFLALWDTQLKRLESLGDAVSPDQIRPLEEISSLFASLPNPPPCAIPLHKALQNSIRLTYSAYSLAAHDSDFDTVQKAFTAAQGARQEFERQFAHWEGH